MSRRLFEEDLFGVIAFGRALIISGDLDPVYIGLVNSDFIIHDFKRLARWLLAYWCYYHCGVSTEVSAKEGWEFWTAMREADERKAPRGRERRHFRGETSRKAIQYLSENYPQPERAVFGLVDRARKNSFHEVSRLVQRWPGFGPWIAFKAADMIERTGLASVDFSVSDIELYKEPVAGAKLAEESLHTSDLASTLDVLQFNLGMMKAPPRYERPVNLQEIETVLCKWKAHLNGRYPVGTDTREIRESLEGFGEESQLFKEALPK